MAEYQPKTGQKCGCKRGVQRDNCPNCEGTGMVVDFAAIRARTQRYDCDGAGPHAPQGPIRKLPTGGGANLLLCERCHAREMDYRRERNKELEAFAQFDLPSWHSLEIYSQG